MGKKKKQEEEERYFLRFTRTYSEESAKQYVAEFAPKVNAFLSEMDEDLTKFSEKAEKHKMNFNDKPIPFSIYFGVHRRAFEKTKFSQYPHIQMSYTEEMWGLITMGKPKGFFESGPAYLPKMKELNDYIATLELKNLEMDGELKAIQKGKDETNAILLDLNVKLEKLKVDHHAIYDTYFPEELRLHFNTSLDIKDKEEK